ncbi:MAG: DUF1684 domain-containing protein [Dechloromonas sp.]|nr:MAG: DUF1684 domain-containing protein [Dechloromonas sp.]
MFDDLKSWQAARQMELASPDSWLGLLGLFWLQVGDNPVGSAESAVVRLPGGPPILGMLRWQDGAVFWLPQGGEAVLLQTDRQGAPTVVECGTVAFFVVEREGQLAARVRDRAWAAGRPPVVLDYFAADPVWRIEAEWQAIEPPLQMEVPNVSGDLKTVSVGHRAEFAVGGQPVALLPMAVGDDEVFFVFRDRTSGKETYGAGRFLKTAPARDGRLVLDFNRAYNPPCAFTPFATCPLPPPENWLPFAVPAGERKWEKPG